MIGPFRRRCHVVWNGTDDLGGGNFIVLNGVTMSTLTASDFLFG